MTMTKKTEKFTFSLQCELQFEANGFYFHNEKEKKETK